MSSRLRVASNRLRAGRPQKKPINPAFTIRHSLFFSLAFPSPEPRILNPAKYHPSLSHSACQETGSLLRVGPGPDALVTPLGDSGEGPQTPWRARVCATSFSQTGDTCGTPPTNHLPHTTYANPESCIPNPGFPGKERSLGEKLRVPITSADRSRRLR